MALCTPTQPAPSVKRVQIKSKKPPGPYAIFVRSMKHLYKGNLAEFSRKCSMEWRKMTEEQKDKFRNQAKVGMNSTKAQKSDYIKFVSASYECLRRKHPDWPAKRIREQLMKNYQKLKCKCGKKK